MRRSLGRLPDPVKTRIRSVLRRIGPVPQRIRTGPARGLTLVAPFWRGRHYCLGYHEPHVLRELEQRVVNGMVACDIGSHFGYLTLALSSLVGPNGRVCAFEPLPESAALLQRTLRRNRLDNVILAPLAVSGRSGESVLEKRSNDAMSRLTADAPTPFSVDRLTVPTTSLDDWIDAHQDLPRLDFIKLDVEGQELAVLQGARSALLRDRPQLICEVHHGSDVPYRPHEIAELLESLGFQVTPLMPDSAPPRPLSSALDSLERMAVKPGWMAVLHLLAVPVEEAGQEADEKGSGRPAERAAKAARRVDSAPRPASNRSLRGPESIGPDGRLRSALRRCPRSSPSPR